MTRVYRGHLRPAPESFRTRGCHIYIVHIYIYVDMFSICEYILSYTHT